MICETAPDCGSENGGERTPCRHGRTDANDPKRPSALRVGREHNSRNDLIWINHILVQGDYASSETVRETMATIIYQCTTTGHRVQGWFSDDGSWDYTDFYEPIICLACKRIHNLNPKTVKVLDRGETPAPQTGDKQLGFVVKRAA